VGHLGASVADAVIGPAKLPIIGRTDAARRMFATSSELLARGNWEIYWDIVPTFLAYLDPAHQTPEQRLATVEAMASQRLIDDRLYEAWVMLNDGLVAQDRQVAAQKLFQGRRALADFEQRVTLQRTVIDPYLQHWRDFSQQFGGYIRSSIPGTRRFVDVVVGGADFGSPDDRLAWFDLDLVPRWDEWRARNPGPIDTRRLYEGGYRNT